MTLKEINVEELFANDSFYTALNAATSVEDVKKVFAEENITVSNDEALEIYNSVTADLDAEAVKVLRSVSSELSEEELENVAGGALGEIAAAIIAAMGGATVATGVLIVAGVVLVGAAVITAYNTYKRMKYRK